MKYVIVAAAFVATTAIAQAQSVTVGAPIVACDSPTGVGCDGRNVLRPGTYRLNHVVVNTGICHVSGPNGSGYTRCSGIQRTRR